MKKAYGKNGEKMKKTLYISLVLGICTVVAVSMMQPAIAQAANTVSIEDVTLAQGASKDVPIRLLNSTGVGGGTVTLTFNPSIVNVTSAVKGDFDSVLNVDYSGLSTGTVNITAMKFGQDLTGDLTFATVTLNAVGSSGSCELGLSAELSTKTGAPVSANVDSGTFTVLSYDNIVSIEDVTLAQGASKDVPIRLLNSTGVGGGTVTLTFNPSIVNVTSAVKGDFDSVLNVDYSGLSTGTVNITAMKFGQDLTGDLTFATVTLNAVGSSGSCELGLSAELSTKTGAPVSANVDSGTFTIPAADTKEPTTEVTVPPDTTPIPSGTTLDWSDSPVMLSFHRSDNTGASPSGVNYTAYKVGAVSWVTKSGEDDFTVNITAEGETIVSYYSVDNAGNTEATKDVNVRIRTPINRTVSLSADPTTIAPDDVSEITAIVMEAENPVENVNVTFVTDFGTFPDFRDTTATVATNERGVAIVNFTAGTEETANIRATEPNGALNTTIVTVKEAVVEIHDVYVDTGYTGTHGTGIRIDNATVEQVDLDQNLTIGETYFVKFKVVNNGTVAPENVNVTVTVSNETWSEELDNYSRTVNEYHLGNETWNTTGLAPGNYTITVNASIENDDAYPGDNTVTRNVVTVRAGLPKTGDMDGVGAVTFDDALHLARYVIAPELYSLHADGNVDSIDDVNFDDALYLARHVIAPDIYPLYP